MRRKLAQTGPVGKLPAGKVGGQWSVVGGQGKKPSLRLITGRMITGRLITGRLITLRMITGRLITGRVITGRLITGP